MKDNVYLAGPMEDATIEEMKLWRSHATANLQSNILKPIPVFDPTRRIPFHQQLHNSLGDERRSMNASRAIFKQDMQDIANSRVILADVRRSSGRGTGTSMELMFAHTHNKIIILWADIEDFPHPFLHSIATEIHYDLDEALFAIENYYT